MQFNTNTSRFRCDSANVCLYNAITSTLWTIASVYTQKQMGLVGAIACLKAAEQPVAGAQIITLKCSNEFFESKVAEQPVAGAFDPKSDVTLANLLHATCFNSMWQPPNLL